MKKTHPVVMLPTEKATKLTLQDGIGLYMGDIEEAGNSAWRNQHLYILSDETADEGDYVVVGGKGVRQVVKTDTKDPSKWVVTGESSAVLSFVYRGACKKIIATTDKSLGIKYDKNPEFYGSGMFNKKLLFPQIPESFIQAYIKAYNEGKPITEVDLEYEQLCIQTGLPCGMTCFNEDTCNMNLQLKTRDDGSVIIHQSKTYSRDDVIDKLILFVETCDVEAQIVHYNVLNSKTTLYENLGFQGWIEENL